MPRKLLTLVLALTLAAVIGACGSSEEGGTERGGSGGDPSGGQAAGAEKPTAVETVQVAYRETAAEQTARTSFQMTMTGPKVDPEGAGRSAPITMAMTGEGVVDFSGEASILSMRMAEMGTMEVRQVGDVVYTKMPEEFTAQTPDARPWVKMDLEEINGGSGGTGVMQGGAAQDPTRQFEYLRGVSDSVEKVGTEQVRGVETTRYRATIDVDEALADLDAGARERYEETMNQAGVEEIPVEIWLDEQNRVRRYAMDMKTDTPDDVPGPSQDTDMRMQMISDYYDFGTAVDVQAPPENQTMDYSKLVQSQQPAAAQ